MRVATIFYNLQLVSAGSLFGLGGGGSGSSEGTTTNTVGECSKVVNNGLCACSVATGCHSLELELAKAVQGEAIIVTSKKDGKMWQVSTLAASSPSLNSTTSNRQKGRDVRVSLDLGKKYQTLLGFGGAITDAASINLYKLKDTKLQDMLLDCYYDKVKGAAYSITRVPIGSTDFSTHVYSYNDNAGDLSQSKFSIQMDMEKKIPMVKRAIERNPDLMLFSSSWSPPAWMMRGNTTIDSVLIGEPGSAYWNSYALYLAKFHQEYAKHNISFSLMTTQNEPVKQPVITKLPGFHHWQSMRLTPKQENEFIKKDLGPMLRNMKLLDSLKILMYDDQKNGLDDFHEALDDQETAQYVAGTAVHWYSNSDFILPFFKGNTQDLQQRHEKYPQKIILATEACEGYLPAFVGTGAGTALADPKKRWKRAENYARDIIADLQNWVVGWTDWNLVLDTKGGPNWAQNNVDAPIIVSDDGLEFYLQPMYYTMAHFSKFLPGRGKSWRIDTQVSDLAKDDVLQVVGFWNDERKQSVVIVQNRGDQDRSVSIEVKGSPGAAFMLSAEGNSLKTIVF